MQHRCIRLLLVPARHGPSSRSISTIRSCAVSLRTQEHAIWQVWVSRGRFAVKCQGIPCVAELQLLELQVHTLKVHLKNNTNNRPSLSGWTGLQL